MKILLIRLSGVPDIREREQGDVQIRVKYQAKDRTLYTTKDCARLFTSSFDINAPAPTPEPTQAPKKSARPVADLYVMAFCPYQQSGGSNHETRC